MNERETMGLRNYLLRSMRAAKDDVIRGVNLAVERRRLAITQPPVIDHECGDDGGHPYSIYDGKPVAPIRDEYIGARMVC